MSHEMIGNQEGITGITSLNYDPMTGHYYGQRLGHQYLDHRLLKAQI
jgi:hypothetical protein